MVVSDFADTTQGRTLQVTLTPDEVNALFGVANLAYNAAGVTLAEKVLAERLMDALVTRLDD